MVRREFVAWLFFAPAMGIVSYCVGTVASLILFDWVTGRRWANLSFLTQPMFHWWFIAVGGMIGLLVYAGARLIRDPLHHLVLMAATLPAVLWLVGSGLNRRGIHPALALGAAASVGLYYLLGRLVKYCSSKAGKG